MATDNYMHSDYSDDDDSDSEIARVIRAHRLYVKQQEELDENAAFEAMAVKRANLRRRRAIDFGDIGDSFDDRPDEQQQESSEQQQREHLEEDSEQSEPEEQEQREPEEEEPQTFVEAFVASPLLLKCTIGLSLALNVYSVIMFATTL